MDICWRMNCYMALEKVSVSISFSPTWHFGACCQDSHRFLAWFLEAFFPLLQLSLKKNSTKKLLRRKEIVLQMVLKNSKLTQSSRKGLSFIEHWGKWYSFYLAMKATTENALNFHKNALQCVCICVSVHASVRVCTLAYLWRDAIYIYVQT